MISFAPFSGSAFKALPISNGFIGETLAENLQEKQSQFLSIEAMLRLGLP